MELARTADRFVDSVFQFNCIASKAPGAALPPGGHFNPNRVGFYLGMMLEEIAETVNEVALCHPEQDKQVAVLRVVNLMEELGKSFKAGDHMYAVMRADRRELLDGTIDTAFVAMGATVYQTPKFIGAIDLVLGKNMDKYPNGVPLLDSNGKVMKPTGWTAPDHTPFVDLTGQ